MKQADKERQIALDPKSNLTLSRQLYEHLRDLILAGELPPGERVLSTRAMAEIAHVSRPTVVESYDQLLQEGYLETRLGSGTFVSTQLPQQSLVATTKGAGDGTQIMKRLSVLGHRLTNSNQSEQEFPHLEISFYSWRPSISDKQLEDWSKIWWRTGRVAENPTLDYQSDPLGHRPLRQAIAKDLEDKRGIRCLPDQIITLASLQQALDLISRLHVDRGDRVAMENPGYPHFRKTAAAHGAEVVPIAVDADGIIVDELLACSTAGLKLLYVTPSHQCPTGAILTLPRRMALLEWAHNNGVLVIEDEDDFETDHCYTGRPIPALMGLDKYESVIYIGSFSKIVAPFVSMTYLVVPESLIPLYSQGRQMTGAQLPASAEHCLTEFIEKGYLKSQVRRMREVYDKRRQALLKALLLHFGDRASLAAHDSGLYVLVTFKTRLSSAEIIQKANQSGVGLLSTAPFYHGKNRRTEFILGYGNLEEKQIAEGIRRLAKVVI